jgi:hypothetical protein
LEAKPIGKTHLPYSNVSANCNAAIGFRIFTAALAFVDVTEAIPKGMVINAAF